MARLVVTSLTLVIALASCEPIPRVPFGPPRVHYLYDRNPSYPFSYGPGPDTTTRSSIVTPTTRSSAAPLPSTVTDLTSPTSSATTTSPSADTSSVLGTSYHSSRLGTSIVPNPTDPSYSSRGTTSPSGPLGASITGIYSYSAANASLPTSFRTSYRSLSADPSSLRPSGLSSSSGGIKGTVAPSASGSLDPPAGYTGKPYPYPNSTVPSYASGSSRGPYGSGIVVPSPAGTSVTGSRSYPYPNATVSSFPTSPPAGTGVSGFPSSGTKIFVTSRAIVTETLPAPSSISGVIGNATSTVLSPAGSGASSTKSVGTAPYPITFTNPRPSGSPTTVTDPRPSSVTAPSGTVRGIGTSGVRTPLPLPTGGVTPYGGGSQTGQGYFDSLLKLFGLGE